MFYSGVNDSEIVQLHNLSSYVSSRKTRLATILRVTPHVTTDWSSVCPPAPTDRASTGLCWSPLRLSGRRGRRGQRGQLVGVSARHVHVEARRAAEDAAAERAPGAALVHRPVVAQVGPLAELLAARLALVARRRRTGAYERARRQAGPGGPPRRRRRRRTGTQRLTNAVHESGRINPT